MPAEFTDDLIQDSSLGATGAQLLRDSTPASVVRAARHRAGLAPADGPRPVQAGGCPRALKVFVSSVESGYEQYRKAARDAIEALGHLPVLMESTHPSAPRPSREECLREVEDSDAVVLLVGSRYGTPQASNKSPTHQEWEHARSVGTPVLVFVEGVDDREARQQDFLTDIGSWETGIFWSRYRAPMELMAEVVRALVALVARMEPTPAEDTAGGLPPPCREQIESLRDSSPLTADRLIGLLSDPASRQPGALSQLAAEPPDWLREAGHVPWEVIGDFIDAHGLGGSWLTREHAVLAGSPRRVLHLVRGAVTAAGEGNEPRALDLISQAPSDHDLIEVGQARISDDPSAAIEAVKAEGLLDAEDPDVALFAVVTLVWAYWRLEQFDVLSEVLREANRRFPARAWLMCHQARSTLGMVQQAGLESAQTHDLLSEVVRLALQSRDLFRLWEGPSHLPVVLAMQALIALEDPQRAADLALPPPDGDATATEAADPDVQARLAHAFLMLGRFNDVDALRLDQVDASEAALIRGMQARGLDDASAPSRMRRAVAHADDESSLRKALFGLALCGEVDEEAMSDLPEPDTALFTGVAALARQEAGEATDILTPHCFVSPFHAHYLAQAQREAGAPEEAVKTLTDAAENFGLESLYESAVEMLIEQDKLDEAMLMATDALARVPSRAAQRRLRTALAAIAERREDWSMMESHARILAQEAPKNASAGWSVVYALHRQMENAKAWAYLVGHELAPIDEDTAQLAIVVCGSVDAPEQDAGRVLEIAGMFPDSEEVSGMALVSLMAGGERLRLSEQQRSRLQELAADFFARYPDSEILRSYSTEQPEELLEIMTAGQRAWSEQVKPLIDQVRHGRWPYGVLRQLRELPYTELLVSSAAGAITAIPGDEDRREHERRAAEHALGGRVAVDTSVVALGIRSDLDVGRMSTAFKSVLVADELIVDARMAVASARRPADAVLGYDPGLGDHTFTEFDDHQRDAAREKAERALGVLSGWQSVKSAHLRSLEPVEEGDFRPWDASLRVARSRALALWCDDLALRGLAESQGIATFGTWALYETLASTARGSWLPAVTELKMRLLRAGIADVPISLSELEMAADYRDGPDAAIQHFLRRPLAWSRDLPNTMKSYLTLFGKLIAGPHQEFAPGLLYAACYGVGAAADTPARQGAIGSLLAAALVHIDDPESTPTLLAAARYAAGELEPAARLDPLEDAVRHLLDAWEDRFGTGPAAQVVTSLFTCVDPADRHTVMTTVLGDR